MMMYIWKLENDFVSTISGRRAEKLSECIELQRETDARQTLFLRNIRNTVTIKAQGELK